MLSRLIKKSVVVSSNAHILKACRAINTTALKVPPPERDLVNFPRYITPERPIAVWGWIPPTWMTNFYEKTGVTGGFTFLATFGTFLLSKEWIVMEHEFYAGISLLVVYLSLKHYVGDQVLTYFDEQSNATNADAYALVDTQKAKSKDLISEGEKAIDNAHAQMVLLEAQKENIGLQLEAAYRQRLVEAHQSIRKKLDYQLEINNIKTRIEQKHVADWIINKVKSSVSPSQEVATFKQCIADLKSLANKA